MKQGLGSWNRFSILGVSRSLEEQQEVLPCLLAFDSAFGANTSNGGVLDFGFV